MTHASRVLSTLASSLVAFAATAADVPLTFSPQLLREDLSALQAQIERIHPDVGHSVDKAVLAKAIAGVEKRLDRAMTAHDAWVVLSTLNPTLADGHLVVVYPGGSAAEVRRHVKAGGLLFPFDVYIDPRGEIFVRSKSNGEPTPFQGARIETIDGVRGKKISTRLLAHTNGDTPALRTEFVSQRFAFLYLKLFGEKRAFNVRIAGKEIVVDGSSSVPAAFADAPFEDVFRFELLPDKHALLKAGEFYWPEKPKFYEFTKDAFSRMQAAGTGTLIIDIRENGGGDDDVWFEGLMPYLATKPYRNGSDYLLKIIEGRQKEGQKVGDVVRGTQDTWHQPELDNPLRFKGKVYVLIGPGTYSSAILFTNAMRDYGFATIAGTGGAARTMQSGGTQNVKLPNTQIGLVVPRFLLKRPAGGEGLLEPDVVIAADPFQPRAAVDELVRLGK